jgi:hypothetical protein
MMALASDQHVGGHGPQRLPWSYPEQYMISKNRAGEQKHGKRQQLRQSPNQGKGALKTEGLLNTAATA